MATVNRRGEILGLLQAFSVRSYLFQHDVCTRVGLHPTDFLALHVLGQRGALTAGALAREIGLTSGATTAVIDRLRAAGFVRRVREDGDRRRVLVELDRRGTARLRRYYEPIDSFVERCLSGCSERDAGVIARFLEALVAMEGTGPGGD